MTDLKTQYNCFYKVQKLFKIKKPLHLFLKDYIYKFLSSFVHQIVFQRFIKSTNAVHVTLSTQLLKMQHFTFLKPILLKPWTVRLLDGRESQAIGIIKSWSSGIWDGNIVHLKPIIKNFANKLWCPDQNVKTKKLKYYCFLND